MFNMSPNSLIGRNPSIVIVKRATDNLGMVLRMFEILRRQKPFSAAKFQISLENVNIAYLSIYSISSKSNSYAIFPLLCSTFQKNLFVIFQCLHLHHDNSIANLRLYIY